MVDLFMTKKQWNKKYHQQKLFFRKIAIKNIKEQQVRKKCIIIIPSHHQISIWHI